MVLDDQQFFYAAARNVSQPLPAIDILNKDGRFFAVRIDAIRNERYAFCLLMGNGSSSATFGSESVANNTMLS